MCHHNNRANDRSSVGINRSSARRSWSLFGFAGGIVQSSQIALGNSAFSLSCKAGDSIHLEMVLRLRYFYMRCAEPFDGGGSQVMPMCSDASLSFLRSSRV